MRYDKENRENIGIDRREMDIDLATQEDKIHWKQDKCPWNVAKKVTLHKCAVKNISLCKYFKGVRYPDTVLCAYPKEE